jgi:purine-nucleoside phosphorylase
LLETLIESVVRSASAVETEPGDDRHPGFESGEPASVQQAVTELRRRGAGNARVGLILGTGLGAVAQGVKVRARIPYREIPSFPVSTALGHAGEWISGEWNGIDLAIMSGRFHLYEGYPFDLIIRPIEVMRELGVETLIVTNAAGGLRPGLRVGDLIVLNDHVNFGFVTPQTPVLPLGGDRGHSRRLYDEGLIDSACRAADVRGIRLFPGTYVGVTGPNYETRAEYRFFRQIGDVVGMSTVPEASAAAALGMRVLGLSTVTNVCDPDDLGVTSGAEVAAAARASEGHLRTILQAVLAELA